MKEEAQIKCVRKDREMKGKGGKDGKEARATRTRERCTHDGPKCLDDGAGIPLFVSVYSKRCFERFFSLQEFFFR